MILPLEVCDDGLHFMWVMDLQPAAGFAPMVKAHGGVVAEFNIEDTPVSYNCRCICLAKVFHASDEVVANILSSNKVDMTSMNTFLSVPISHNMTPAICAG